MNLSTIFYLKSYMESHRYGKDYTFVSLFKDFFGKEIRNLDDMESVAADYLNLLFKLRVYLTELPVNEENADDLSEEILEIREGLNAAFMPESKFIQRCYTKLIESISDKNTKLLDVGAGMVPLSSILMADDGMQVSTMDKLITPEGLLDNYNLKGYSEYFTSDTDISKYDVVVGNRPCSAIPKIVENCARQNKGYLISLCGCDISQYKDSHGKTARSWRDVLPQYDKKVKFYGGVAYNIDISKRQLKKLVDEFYDGVDRATKTIMFKSFFNPLIEEMLSIIERDIAGSSEPGDD